MQVSVIDLRNEEGIWDLFVKNHPNGWITHLSGWKKVLDKSFYHMKGHYLVIREGSFIRSALPVYEVNRWLTGKRLVSIPFATLCHPLVSDENDMITLLQAALELGKEIGAAYVEIRTMSEKGEIQDGRFSTSKRFKHHYLLLDAEPEILKKRFDRTCVRQRISRATSRGVSIERVVDESGLAAFFRIHMITRKRLGLPPHPCRFIRSLWNVFSPSGQLAVNLAKFDGQYIGGIMLFQFNGRISAEYLVSDENFRDLSPNHILLWDAIQKGCRDGCQVFDFGRTHVSNEGLMDFKKRWGTDVVDLPIFYSPPSKQVFRLQEWNPDRHATVVKIFNRMPLLLLRAVGSSYYRFLG